MAEKLNSNDYKVLENFGNQLKSLLKELKLTQKQLAKGIDVKPYTVSLWVNGKVNITLTNLYKIIDFFHDSYPDSNPVLSILPDFIGNEYTNMWKKQRTNILNRLKSTCKKLNYDLLNDLGIKDWTDLFEDPLEYKMKKILNN